MLPLWSSPYHCQFLQIHLALLYSNIITLLLVVVLVSFADVAVVGVVVVVGRVDIRIINIINGMVVVIGIHR